MTFEEKKEILIKLHAKFQKYEIDATWCDDPFLSSHMIKTKHFLLELQADGEVVIVEYKPDLNMIGNRILAREITEKNKTEL